MWGLSGLWFTGNQITIIKSFRVRNYSLLLEIKPTRYIKAIQIIAIWVFQITVPNPKKVSSWGSYDTTTIKKDLTAVMGVTFAVKR